MTNSSTWAAIGLGGNLGDRAKTLDDAVAALAGTPGVDVLKVSSYHQTAPAGGPEGQGAYLNAALTLATTLGPLDLLRVMQRIEIEAGRVRADRWGARTLDLDFLLAGHFRIQTPELTVPHPLMAVRRFVLAPLAEIAPDAIHPTTGRTILDLLANLDRRPSRVEVVDADDARREAVVARLVAMLDPSTWLVSRANFTGVRPSGGPTLRVLVGAPQGDRVDGVPTVVAPVEGVEAVVAFLLALFRGSQGA